jgi:hypothetical protein
LDKAIEGGMTVTGAPPPPEDGRKHAEPVGVRVYVSEPLVWAMVSVSMSDPPLNEQTRFILPPLPLMEEDSDWGAVRVKVSPADNVIAALAAFIVRPSATDPACITRVSWGVER